MIPQSMALFWPHPYFFYTDAGPTEDQAHISRMTV